MDEKQISAVMSAMGRKGGKVRSEKQRVSMMQNLAKAQEKRDWMLESALHKLESSPNNRIAVGLSILSADLKREEQDNG